MQIAPPSTLTTDGPILLGVNWFNLDGPIHLGDENATFNLVRWSHTSWAKPGRTAIRIMCNTRGNIFLQFSKRKKIQFNFSGQVLRFRNSLLFSESAQKYVPFNFTVNFSTDRAITSEYVKFHGDNISMLSLFTNNFFFCQSLLKCISSVSLHLLLYLYIFSFKPGWFSKKSPPKLPTRRALKTNTRICPSKVTHASLLKLHWTLDIVDTFGDYQNVSSHEDPRFDKRHLEVPALAKIFTILFFHFLFSFGFNWKYSASRHILNFSSIGARVLKCHQPRSFVFDVSTKTSKILFV